MFPLETVEHVVSFLWEDRCSLSHCTLVSRTWYTATRPLLFRRVVLDGWDRLEELEALLLKEPTVGFWIRELCVEEHAGPSRRPCLFNTRRGELLSVDTDPSDQFPGPVLSEQLQKLHALTLVCIRATVPSTSAVFLRNASKAFAPTVRSLTFQSCEGHRGFFLALMHAFPRVHEIKSLGTRTRVYLPPDDWEDELQAFEEDHVPFYQMCTLSSRPDPQHTHPNIPLTSLRLDHRDFVYDSESMFCLRSLRNVQNLEINHSGALLHPFDHIPNTILPECGRGLRSLKLSIVNLPSISVTKGYDVLWMRGFTHLIGLRLLELDLRPIRHPFVGLLLDTCQHWCIRLTRLVLHVYISSLHRADVVPLDRRFRAASFRALKEVCFRYGGPVSESEARIWLKNTFPDLTQAVHDGRLRMRLERVNHMELRPHSFPA